MGDITKILKPYVARLRQSAVRGDAREESFYPALEFLLNEFSNLTNKKDIYVTVLPKETDAGNPDFRIWHGKRIVGYIEAKILEKDLDEAEKTKQINRYSATFPNFILTNFIEFRLYKSGNCVDEVRISELKNIYSQDAKIVPAKGQNDFEMMMKPTIT
jgi:hypothetical protein